ncbi:hypothetical protein [Jiella endophytica]|uniref:hypothetical protein n=1 Tax=Jiella endophytica TaxID=2558362 RepID=UPI001FE1BF44|nr:hypothetical protein [Jiella endophytica]
MSKLGIALVQESAERVYPGETASAAEIFALAESYRDAAVALRQCGRPGEPLTLEPFRLAAIHAVELYLNALLVLEGQPATVVRGLQHDLAERAARVATLGLCLRKRTARHLRAMSAGREYLRTRYDPAATRDLSQVNRLEATLEEVRRKVAQKFVAGS